MIAGDKIPDLVGYVDVETIHVHAPKSGIFLCGGQVDAKSLYPLSLRDAFMRIHSASPFSEHLVILAEDLNAFFPQGFYSDILSFEGDIAQISELIILFSESFGSVAELGAFVMVPEIASRLLVVVDDKNYRDQSFIRLGPLLSLENQYGESAVYVVHRNDIGIASIKDIASINLKVFADRLKDAIKTRMATTKEPSKFDPTRNGHVIKLVVGLIQHYSALTLDEIGCLLYC